MSFLEFLPVVITIYRYFLILSNESTARRKNLANASCELRDQKKKLIYVFSYNEGAIGAGASL